MASGAIGVAEAVGSAIVSVRAVKTVASEVSAEVGAVMAGDSKWYRPPVMLLRRLVQGLYPVLGLGTPGRKLLPTETSLDSVPRACL